MTMYTALATTTLGSAASTVTFGSIPQGYRDLMLVIAGRSASSGNVVEMYFNGDTGANYSHVRMGGNGSNPFSTSKSDARVFNMTTNEGVSIIQIMDYSATDKHKTSISTSSIAQDFVLAYAQRWASTSAVTSIELIFQTAINFAAGTTLSLYGIAGGS